MLNLLRRFNAQKLLFLCQNTGNPRWTSIGYDALAEEGFQKNVFAYRAINLISKNIASIPVNIRENHDIGEVDRLNESGECSNKINLRLQKLCKLCDRPNAKQTRNAFVEMLVNFLLISGNAYIYFGENEELRCLRPDRVQIVPNKNNTGADSYVYTVDSAKFSLEEGKVLHIKFFNPLNDWYGYSPLQAASQSIDQYNEMSRHNLAILQNGGRPSGCFTVKNGVNLTDEQREQLRADIQNAYAGAKKAGKILLLEGGLEWKEMGLSPKDLDFETGKNVAAREIAQAFGIPPILLGIKGDAAFSSYREARLHFWEDTILPLAEYVWNEIVEWLAEKYQLDVTVNLNIESIQALSEKREAVWRKISDSKFLSDEEKREILWTQNYGYSLSKKADGEAVNSKQEENEEAAEKIDKEKNSANFSELEQQK